jgi:hypothetical protein
VYLCIYAHIHTLSRIVKQLSASQQSVHLAKCPPGKASARVSAQEALEEQLEARGVCGQARREKARAPPAGLISATTATTLGHIRTRIQATQNKKKSLFERGPGRNEKNEKMEKKSGLVTANTKTKRNIFEKNEKGYF